MTDDGVVKTGYFPGSRAQTEENRAVTVVMPSYNEEASVADQVRDVSRVLASRNIEHEVIVVDDGSVDGTSDAALEAGARVLKHPKNRGYGASLKTGILAATYERIVIIDADGTYPSEQIPPMLEQLDSSDMVVGARVGSKVHIPLIRKPAKWVLGWLANRIAGQTIPDLNSGLRAFRRDCVKQYFSILPNKFSFTTTVTLAYLADDYRVIYHPIDYHRRVGKSKITPRNFMDFMILVLRMAMLFNPLKVFVPLSLFTGFLGVSKAVFDIVALFQRAKHLEWALVYQPVISTTAILLLLISLQFLLIGMVADGLGRRMDRGTRTMIESSAVRSMERRSPGKPGTKPGPKRGHKR